MGHNNNVRTWQLGHLPPPPFLSPPGPPRPPSPAPTSFPQPRSCYRLRPASDPSPTVSSVASPLSQLFPTSQVADFRLQLSVLSLRPPPLAPNSSQRLAPKPMWTSTEERMLGVGVGEHGAGGWRTPRMDPTPPSSRLGYPSLPSILPPLSLFSLSPLTSLGRNRASSIPTASSSFSSFPIFPDNSSSCVPPAPLLLSFQRLFLSLSLSLSTASQDKRPSSRSPFLSRHLFSLRPSFQWHGCCSQAVCVEGVPRKHSNVRPISLSELSLPPSTSPASWRMTAPGKEVLWTEDFLVLCIELPIFASAPLFSNPK